MQLSINFRDVVSAKRRIEQHIKKTPIMTSSRLNHWLGHEILFKMECLQHVGAFKARGAMNAIQSYLEFQEPPKKIITFSSGNHAQAIAWASDRFRIPADVYMDKAASSVKKNATRSYGATVIECETRLEAQERVAEAAEASDILMIPPYNHRDVIAGQGTCMLEVFDEIKQPIDAVFAPCGGGGLISGCYVATKALSPETKVMGVEPVQANDAAQSIRLGRIVHLKGTPNTIADGVKTLSVGDLTFPQIQQLDGFYEVPEDDICYWTQWLQHLLKVHIEPTSAMSMSGVLGYLKVQSTPQRVMVVVTGGNIAAETMLKIWQDDHLAEVPRLSE